MAPHNTLRRAWHSPTVTTWAGTVARAAGFAIVLPLVLVRLSVEEIAVWYLLSSIIALQSIADSGFAPTFVRVMSYAVGGAQQLRGFSRVADDATQRDSAPNYALMARIWDTSQTIYNRLAIGTIIVLGSSGALAMWKPINALVSPAVGWTAFVAVILGTAVVVRGNAFAAYLQGSNEIALVRRWEAATAVAASLTSIIVLLAGGQLLALAIATQAWSAVNVGRNLWLARRLQVRQFDHALPLNADPDRWVLTEIWPAAWRSAIGIATSRGVVYASGLVYAQLATASSVASYLLALRLMLTISEMSQAPFYSKLPRLAQLVSSARWTSATELAASGMRNAYWVFAAGFITLGTLGEALTRQIGSNVAFVEPSLWWLIGTAFFLERYGAMHIHLYSTTNHIVWHIANGVSGAINVVSTWLLLDPIGVYAFPVGMIAGLLGFYCWYSAKHSYRAFGIVFWRFESRTALGPAVAIAFYGIVALSNGWLGK